MGRLPRQRRPPRPGHDRPRQGAPALSARTQRLPAHRPRQEHLAQLRAGPRIRRREPPALRRHQPRKRRAGIRRLHPRRREVARLRDLPGRPPQRPRHPAAARVLREQLLRLHVRSSRVPDRRRPRLRGRADRRGSAREPRRLQHPRHRQPLPHPHARRKPRALSRHARRPGRRRRRHPARQDRHGEPQHQHARPRALPRAPGHAPQHRRQVVHLPDVHLRAPDRRRAGADHPLHLHARIRRPAPLLRLAARPPRRRRPHRQPAPAPVRIRAPERHARDDQQAQAAPAGRRGPRRRLGRPPHAHHRWPAPPRLHARGAAPVLRAQRHHQVRAAGSTTRAWKPRCATAWTRSPRAPWPCSTRSSW
jgi:hypothetical protein